MSSSLSDIRLKILSDDYGAFKELYLRMYSSLLKFATIYTYDRSMAEDVLADVFLKLWDQRKQIGNIQHLKVYLYTAVKNTALNSRDRQWRMTADSQSLLDRPSGSPDPEVAMISSETRKNIQRAINGLPARCKLIYQLAKEEGLRYKEISAILGISVKTIDNQLAIAIQRIGEAILAQEKSSSR